jgi:hypothetical protein
MEYIEDFSLFTGKRARRLTGYRVLRNKITDLKTEEKSSNLELFFLRLFESPSFHLQFCIPRLKRKKK